MGRPRYMLRDAKANDSSIAASKRKCGNCPWPLLAEDSREDEDNTGSAVRHMYVLEELPSKESEVFARGALLAKNATEDSVWHALRTADIPWSTTRGNVIPDNEAGVHGMLLGIYAYADVGISRATRENPWLTRLVVEFLEHVRPGFNFTSIQVNKNYVARLHVDANNLGTSLIFGFGDYTGGELWVEDSEGDEPMLLPDAVRSKYSYKSGEVYMGTLHDARGKLVEFNGNRLHCTRPFEGDRYTLVYFICDRYREAPGKVRRALADAGFQFAWESAELEELRKQNEKEREELALVKRRRMVRNGDKAGEVQLERCLARTWNNGWGGQCHAFQSSPSTIFCGSHGNAKETWRTHGRVDGEVPEAKRQEMYRRQKKLIDSGEKPPDPLPLGACLLVD